ncbi:F0F1 ATP synthase subunit epsilon [Staphylococcus pasteuri]|uniref:ATP synthase epsilon chain n=1 Tax=Staphylococcus pasteuri_A TaxID=3062664 RepID=A0AAW7YX26_9STAP|nr:MULTISPECIES: F0F1 ATP synthase subunit epsilon [Staphylococcus]ODB70553.1 F0F1 ATP synthase subunit epsilon [Staphylococcus sp. AOAB]RQX26394.1 F0F1 ATP synthase subunit epsilon [Staphylococcus warneri]MBL3399491.1 F0F1 ATP synthase subunit epsilon [Staphylococcus pasteuri]MBM6507834.1 F0F1 ATP synthase subunit epsilon [Staphylococcus pasteuri]MCD9067597.1 F0F1 ATP synthase subunit epsilon [Staphylococcus pasteuri]
MNTLSLEIVTPNGSIYERDDVELAVLQTTAGEMGVMNGHIPTVSALKTGYVKVNFHNGNEYVAVSDGFVEVRQHQLSIIVQTAETATEIDVERAKLAKARAESHLDNDDNSDINRAKRALERANNRLRVAELK